MFAAVQKKKNQDRTRFAASDLRTERIPGQRIIFVRSMSSRPRKSLSHGRQIGQRNENFKQFWWLEKVPMAVDSCLGQRHLMIEDYSSIHEMWRRWIVVNNQVLTRLPQKRQEVFQCRAHCQDMIRRQDGPSDDQRHVKDVAELTKRHETMNLSTVEATQWTSCQAQKEKQRLMSVVGEAWRIRTGNCSNSDDGHRGTTKHEASVH